MNRLFDSFFGRPTAIEPALGVRAWMPVVDMYEAKDDVVERVHGKFEPTIQLPVPVQTDKVQATYRDGVLEVRLPTAEEVTPKAINIDIP